jgi:hypothetical protein
LSATGSNQIWKQLKKLIDDSNNQNDVWGKYTKINIR